jgi:hypothetical protein
MSKGFEPIGRLDLPGGGQVTVEGNYAYVGHMGPPNGTSIVDVSDPRHPRLVTTLEVPKHTHSHKVRVHGDVMLVNYEQFGRLDPEFHGGMKVFDISNKAKPAEIAFFQCDGGGMHRFDYDGTYAYISPQVHGWFGNIAMIVDMRDPRRPAEVSKWWMPGQWVAGGEKPTWQGARHRCHHPLRLGNRLYTSYWHGGFFILDIDDITKPKMVSHVDWSPPYPCPTHTALPIPHEIGGRKFLVVTDEEVSDRLSPTPNAFLWVVDVTDETKPVPVATFRVPHDKPFDQDCWFGAHQPQEQVDGNVLFVTWFAGGLRAVDISDPYAPREVGHYMPKPGPGQSIVQSNDVFYDRKTGLIYVIDRLNGLDIVAFND